MQHARFFNKAHNPKIGKSNNLKLLEQVFNYAKIRHGVVFPSHLHNALLHNVLTEISTGIKDNMNLQERWFIRLCWWFYCLTPNMIYNRVTIHPTKNQHSILSLLRRKGLLLVWLFVWAQPIDNELFLQCTLICENDAAQNPSER